MSVDSLTFRKFREYAASLGAPASPRRILVVDDDEMVRQFVSRTLVIAGYRVETAASGSEALDVFDGGATFDLVISDVRMPSMSGPRFIEHLRGIEPDLKILYLTGYKQRLFAERGTLSDHEALLEKPCTVNGLLEAVATQIHLS